MAEMIHPFYEQHRGAMEAAMRHRLDLAEAMLRERAHLTDIDGIRQEVMDEFDIVLTQMPYVGGAASRMSDFFMRLIGFMAISRVLRRHGVPLPVIGEIERETYKAQLLTTPEAERLASGRQFMSPENRTLLREQAAKSVTESHQNEFPEDFVYDFVEPGPNDNFEFGINYKACGFCKFAAAMATRKSCRTFAGSISTPMQREASTWNGHKRWLAARATAISASRDCSVTVDFAPWLMRATPAVLVVHGIMAVDNRHAVAVAELQLAQPGLVGDAGVAVHVDLALEITEHQRRAW